jgi:hypothetical protein
MRLEEDFPFEKFALYPPLHLGEQWIIVLASFVDRARAERARELAKALGVAFAPTVWRLPDPLDTTPEWHPATPSVDADKAVGVAPGKSGDLATRLALWRKDAPFCDFAGHMWDHSTPRPADLFPTKEYAEAAQRAQRPEPCNDGDMGLFNGMLCAAGEERGCFGVANSSDQRDGVHQWWRSPAIRIRAQDKPEEPNLNSDQVLGLMLYVLQEHKPTAFRDWLEWIRSKGPPPRYCDTDPAKCRFMPIDCSLITVTAFALGEQNAAAQLCTPVLVLGLPIPSGYRPRFEDAVAAYKQAVGFYNDMRDAVSTLRKTLAMSDLPDNPLPPAPNLDKFNAKLVNINNHFQKIVDRLQLPDPFAFAVAYYAASTQAVANAAVAGIGQGAGEGASARHLAATALFILQKFRFPDPGLNVAAMKLSEQERDNAYFEFLARGPSQRMRELIMDECVYDPAANEPKYQWSWERSVSKDAAKQTMLWDCIFAADLLQLGLTPMKTKIPGDPASFLPSVEVLWRNFQDAANEMEALLKEALDVRAEIDSLKDTLKDQLEYLKQLAGAAVKGGLPRRNPDGSYSVPMGGPGGPTATVDPDKGKACVCAFGACVGSC